MLLFDIRMGPKSVRRLILTYGFGAGMVLWAGTHLDRFLEEGPDQLGERRVVLLRHRAFGGNASLLLSKGIRAIIAPDHPGARPGHRRT